MIVADVKAHISSKNLLPVYIFTGEEIAVLNIYINQMAKVLDSQVIRLDTFVDVYKKISKQTTMSAPCVYVVRDDKDIITNEKAQRLIDTADWKDTVVFVFNSVDKRTKFAKKYKDTICEFESLKNEILRKYIKKEIQLSNKNCDRLIEVCENSYGRILLEIDKIKQYTDANVTLIKNIYDNAFDILLESGTIYKPSRDAIFIWVQAVMERKNITEIFKLWRECVDSGEATLVMLSVLYDNVKHTLQLQTCKSKEVSKATGLTGWQIKCVQPFVGNYKVSELLKYMRIIRECEVGIKTGKYNEDVCVPYVLVSVL